VPERLHLGVTYPRARKAAIADGACSQKRAGHRSKATAGGNEQSARLVEHAK
jgi:hypothetical protein